MLTWNVSAFLAVRAPLERCLPGQAGHVGNKGGPGVANLRTILPWGPIWASIQDRWRNPAGTTSPLPPSTNPTTTRQGSERSAQRLIRLYNRATNSDPEAPRAEDEAE